MLVKIDSFRSESKILTMTVSELKRSYSGLTEELKDEGIKAKNILSVSNTILEFARKFQIPVQDSELIIRGDTIKAPCAKLKDRYIDFVSCMYNDSSYTSIVVPDSALNVLHKKPRTLWQWLDGEPKQYYQFMKNSNPYVNLKYNEIIQVTK
jgi:hypothetical protein